MSRFQQNIISKRFLEVVDELLDKEVVDSVAEFCKRVDYKTQSMSQIRHGKRDVTLELVSKLFTEFGGNPIYLLSGKGQKILDGENGNSIAEPSGEYQIKNDKGTLRTLEKLVESKDEIIMLLKNEVNRLNHDLKKV